MFKPKLRWLNSIRWFKILFILNSNIVKIPFISLRCTRNNIQLVVWAYVTTPLYISLLHISQIQEEGIVAPEQPKAGDYVSPKAVKFNHNPDDLAAMKSKLWTWAAYCQEPGESNGRVAAKYSGSMMYKEPAGYDCSVKLWVRCVVMTFKRIILEK